MTKLYSTTNPQGLIDLFEMRAKREDDIANRETKRSQVMLTTQAAANTWRAAADIIRNTEFVGWLHDGMTVDEIKNSNTPAAQAAAARLMKG